MANDTDLQGLIPAIFGVTFYTANNGGPISLSRDVRGGLASYTTAERNAIDGRRLETGMVIWNSEDTEYQMLSGGARQTNGQLTGGTWRTLYLPVDSDAVGPGQIDALNSNLPNTVLHLDTDEFGNFQLSWRSAGTQSISAGSITSDLLNENVAGAGLIKPSMSSGLQIDTDFGLTLNPGPSDTDAGLAVDTEVIADTDFVKSYVANNATGNVGLFSTTQDGLVPRTTDSEFNFRHYLRGDQRWAEQVVTGRGDSDNIVLVHNTVTAGVKAAGTMTFSGPAAGGSYNGLVIEIRQPDGTYQQTVPFPSGGTGNASGLVLALQVANSFQGFLNNLSGIRNVRYLSPSATITWEYTTPAPIDTDTDIVRVSGTVFSVASSLTRQGITPGDTEFANTIIPIDTDYMATQRFARIPFVGAVNVQPDTLRLTFNGSVTTPFTPTASTNYNFYLSDTDTSPLSISTESSPPLLTTATDVRDFILSTYNSSNAFQKIATADSEGTDTIVFTAGGPILTTVNRTFISGITDFGFNGLEGGSLAGMTMAVTSSSFSNILPATGDSDSEGASLFVENPVLQNVFPFSTGRIANGVPGAVPAPDSDQSNLFLRGDGTWQRVTDSDTMYMAGYGLTQSNTTLSVDTETIADTEWVVDNTRITIDIDTDNGIPYPHKRLEWRRVGIDRIGDPSLDQLTLASTEGLDITILNPNTNLVDIKVDTDFIADTEFVKGYVATHAGVIDTELSEGYGLNITTVGNRHQINVDTDVIATRAYATYRSGFGLEIDSDSRFSIDTERFLPRAPVDTDSDVNYYMLQEGYHGEVSTQPPSNFYDTEGDGIFNRNGITLGASDQIQFTFVHGVWINNITEAIQRFPSGARVELQTDRGTITFVVDNVVPNSFITNNIISRIVINARDITGNINSGLDSDTAFIDSDGVRVFVTDFINSIRWRNFKESVDAGNGLIRDTDSDDDVIRFNIDTEHPHGVATRQYVEDRLEDANFILNIFDTDQDGLVPRPDVNEVNHLYHLSADREWRSLELTQRADDSEKRISLRTQSTGARGRVRVAVGGFGNINGNIIVTDPNGDSDSSLSIGTSNGTPQEILLALSLSPAQLGAIDSITNIQYFPSQGFFTFDYAVPGPVPANPIRYTNPGTGITLGPIVTLTDGAFATDTEYSVVAITPFTDSDGSIVGLVPAPGATRSRSDILYTDGWGPNGRTNISAFNTLRDRNADTDLVKYKGQIVQVIGNGITSPLPQDPSVPGGAIPSGIWFFKPTGPDSDTTVIFRYITREQAERYVRPGAEIFNDLIGLFGINFTLDTVQPYDSDTYTITATVKPGSDYNEFDSNSQYYAYFQIETQSVNRGLYQYIGPDRHQGITTDTDWYFLTGNYSSPPKEDYRSISDRNRNATIRWKIGDFVSVGEEVYVYSGPPAVKGNQPINSDQLEAGPTTSLEWTQIGFTGLKGDTIQDVRYYNEY